MSTEHLPPRARLHGWIDRISERFSVAPTVAIGLLNLAGGILLALVGDWATPGGKWRAGIGGGLLLLALIITIVVEWWRQATERAQHQEVTQFTVAVTDVLTPMMARVAELGLFDSPTRQRKLEGIVSEAASNLLLLFKHVDRPRAVVYEFNKNGKKLESRVHVGRTDRPGPFKHGDSDRGDAAFEMISQGAHLFSPDVDKLPPENWKGTGKSYKAFISASIFADDQGYGMLTIDTPKTGDLSDADVKLVVLIATILGAAYASTFRSRDALKMSDGS